MRKTRRDNKVSLYFSQGTGNPRSELWSGPRFSKIPKLFERILGDIVSSKRRRLEARNFAVILIFVPFTTYEKTSFSEKAGRSLKNGFSGPNIFRDFRETGSRCIFHTTSCFRDQNPSGNRDERVGPQKRSEEWIIR